MVVVRTPNERLEQICRDDGLCIQRGCGALELAGCDRTTRRVLDDNPGMGFARDRDLDAAAGCRRGVRPGPEVIQALADRQRHGYTDHGRLVGHNLEIAAPTGGF